MIPYFGNFGVIYIKFVIQKLTKTYKNIQKTYINPGV